MPCTSPSFARVHVYCPNFRHPDRICANRRMSVTRLWRFTCVFLSYCTLISHDIPPDLQSSDTWRIAIEEFCQGVLRSFLDDNLTSCDVSDDSLTYLYLVPVPERLNNSSSFNPRHSVELQPFRGRDSDSVSAAARDIFLLRRTRDSMNRYLTSSFRKTESYMV